MTDLQAWIEVGRCAGSYGVRGWIRVLPHAGGESLAASRLWRIGRDAGTASETAVLEVRRHGPGLIARVEGIQDKESADRLRGAVFVRRGDFPDAGPGEVWAADLPGCRVVNREGVELGRVAAVGSNGVQDILRVRRGAEGGGTAAEYLIPMGPQYVDSVRPDEGLITVDWQPDWT